jgi:hypothetical protein
MSKLKIKRSYGVTMNIPKEENNPKPKYEPFDFSQIDTPTIEQKEQEEITKKKRITKK